MPLEKGLSRRQFLTRITVFGAGLALASCAPAATPTPEVKPAEEKPAAEEPTGAAKPTQVTETIVPAEAPKATKEVITVEWWVPNFHMNGAGPMKAKIEEALPGIKVDQTETVWEGLWEKIYTTLQGQTQPDIIDVAVAWNAPMAMDGLLLDVTDRNPDWADWQPGALATATYKDRVYGVPFRSEAIAFVWNKGIFEAAGLDPNTPPKTWEELATFAVQMNNPPDHYGYGVVAGDPEGSMWRALTYIWANDGDVLNSDYTHAVCNQPACVEALEFYSNLVTVHKVAPEIALTANPSDMDDLFSAGKVAMYVTGPYVVPRLLKDAPDLKWGASPSIKRKKIAGPLGGWNYVVPKLSKHPDEAWDVLAFMTSPEQIADLVHPTGNFPARKSGLLSPLYSEDTDKGPFAEQLQYARAMPPIAQWEEIQRETWAHVQSVMLGQRSIQEAMDAAAEQIDGLLQQG